MDQRKPGDSRPPQSRSDLYCMACLAVLVLVLTGISLALMLTSWDS